DHGVNAVCRRPHFWPEILRGFQPRLGARLDRPAHRIGFPGEIAGVTKFSGKPTVDPFPSPITRSSSAHSNRSLASFSAFFRTTFEASLTALPATTAPRLAKVPAPQ